MALLNTKTNPINSIPQYNSSSEEWLSWHKVLTSNFGRQNANSIWLKAWRIRGNPKANDRTLRVYLKSKGITLSETAWDNIVDIGGGITDTLGDAMQLRKYAGIALGVILIGGLGLAIYNLTKGKTVNVLATGASKAVASAPNALSKIKII
jgi:hypothetical protein